MSDLIIQRLYSVGMWNSLQTIPEPYSSGEPPSLPGFADAVAKKHSPKIDPARERGIPIMAIADLLEVLDR